MARKNPLPESPSTITLERAVRLYRLVRALGEAPRKRTALTRKLGLGVRGFYRDLEVLRAFRIGVSVENGKYSLTDDMRLSLEKLPFPDAGLTLGEARLVGRGRTRAHRKIKGILALIEEEPD